MVDIPICINYGLWVDETIYLVGGFNPSEKKKSQLDDDIPNWMESRKIHVPNHQPVMVDKTIEVTYLYGEHD